MKVAAITSDGDWTFGSGKSNYKSGSKSIRQNIITRLRSFKNDWFLNIEAGINWLSILSRPNNQRLIEEAVASTVLGTEGVRSIESIELIKTANREVSINIFYTDVFDNQLLINESIQA